MRRQWGGGGRLLYANLYMSRVKWYDNTHNFSILLKKGLLLTAIQIRGTAETRRCVADAVRLQVIKLNAPLTLRASYLPLPPPSSSPCSHSCPLSQSLLIQHMVHRGVSTQLPSIKIIGILVFNKSFFALLFSAASYPYIFRNTPCRKNAPPFFHQSSIRKSFSRCLLCHNFYSSLINMPIIHIEEIKTSLLTLFGCVPGFMEEKGR